MPRISDAEEARLWALRQKKNAERAKERAADIEVTGEVADQLGHVADLGDVNNSDRNMAGRSARFAKRRTPTSKGKQWLAELKAKQERGEL